MEMNLIKEKRNTFLNVLIESLFRFFSEYENEQSRPGATANFVKYGRMS